MTRTGWAKVPTGRSCRWGFSGPRGPSRCRPNSLSTWADSAQAPLCPAVWGLDTGRRKPEPALTGLALGRWPQDPRSRSVSWAPMEPTAAEAGALPCTFQRTSEGFPSLAVPPRHPWCWLWGHSPPPSGREGHIVHHQIQEPRAMGNILARLLSESAPRSPASVVPPSRWVSPPFRTAVFHHGAACLAPCLTGTATPPQPDCQQFLRQANPRNIFNNLLQILPAYSGRTLPQTQTLKCHLPAPGTASPNTQFNLEIF